MKQFEQLAARQINRKCRIKYLCKSGPIAQLVRAVDSSNGAFNVKALNRTG